MLNIEETEYWIPLNGFDTYEISNKGRIRSLYITKYHKILKQHKIFGSDYFTVTLVKNKKKYEKSVHRLIAEHFIPNPNNYPIVNHIDCNTENNEISNLEWCTHSYNIQYAFDLGRKEGPQHRRGTKSNSARSKYHYVYWESKCKLWRCSIAHKGKKIYLGRFKNEIDAAKTADNYIKSNNLPYKVNFN